ncbi:MAG: response regulator [Vicinamibacterales bacterium]|nr:response regulator [Vicinamibacterales bacterium]
MTIHPLLARQLRRLGLDEQAPPAGLAQWQALLERVTHCYDDADRDRYLGERALAVSSQEMQALYDDLQLRSDLALAEAHDRLRAILGSLAEGVCVLDRGLRVVLVNDEATRLTGLAVEAAAEADLEAPAWLRPEHAASLREACRQALDSRQTAHVESLEVVGPDGACVPTGCAVSPILHGGHSAGVVLTLHDLSRQRMASEDLVRARDDAEAATRAKSEFLASMSHELRTPLNGIIGMSGLLLETALDETQYEYASTVKTCAEGVVSIISDILDFSKIEAGRLELERQPFDLHTLVEDAVAVVADAAHRRDIELLCDIAAEVPRDVVGDPGRLKQLLLNLLSNAVKFTERGEVAVSVSLAGAPGASPAPVRVEVSDTGIGIAPDALPRLFERFSQADASTTRRFGGTGLGLAICRRLVQLMGGDISVRSQVGSGTTFAVTLPVTPDPDHAAPRDRYVAAGERVLCVDDNPRQRQHLAGLATRLGLRSATAPHAIAAFDVLREAARAGDRFGAVVVDQHMPQVSGLDLVRWMRAEPSLASTSVILLTPTGSRTPALDEGNLRLSGRLAKPVRRAALVEVLARSLGWTERVESPVRGRASQVVGTGRRVLVAEDNAVNQRVIVAQLRRLGFFPDLARNGIEAVAAVSTGHYDVVLMDCQMPEMDGFEATRAIRMLTGAARHVPVVALTASALTTDRDRCFEAGMNDFLAKPVDHDRLAEALDRWLPKVSAA